MIDPHTAYTADEAAALLRVCPDTLYRMAGAGKLRTVRVGGPRGRHRVMGSELLRVLGVAAAPEVETIPERKARARRAIERIRQLRAYAG